MILRYKKTVEENDKRQEGVKFIYTDFVKDYYGSIGSFDYLPESLILPMSRNRICQVFWSKPSKQDFKNARWNIGNQFEMTLPMCALSLAMLKEMSQEVVMYTDYEGEELLKDLGYDKIYNVFDKLEVNNDFWAAGKMFALQNEPLDSILVDTDVFLYDGRLLDKACNMKIFGSHRENTEAYIKMLEFGQTYFQHLLGDASVSTNVGLLKIGDYFKKTSFITAYWTGLRYFSQNEDLLEMFKKEGKGTYCPDLLIEQFNFHKICNPDVLIELPESPKDAQGFVHLLSFEKYLKLPLVLEVLKKRYPDYYGKVISKWDSINFHVEYEIDD